MKSDSEGCIVSGNGQIALIKLVEGTEDFELSCQEYLLPSDLYSKSCKLGSRLLIPRELQRHRVLSKKEGLLHL